MPKPIKRNEAKLTAWTDSGTRMDVSGGIIGVLDIAFTCLTPAQRVKTLEKLQASQVKLLAREAERAAEAVEAAP
jgi:hypothetical protein